MSEQAPNHPEMVDPPWFRELVRKAFDREVRRLHDSGLGIDDAFEGAMWFVFDVRHNLTELYQAARGQST